MRKLLISLAALLWVACGANTQHRNGSSGGSTATGANSSSSGGSTGGVIANGGSTATGGNGSSSGAASACSSDTPGSLFVVELRRDPASGQTSAPQCLPRVLTTDGEGRVACSIVRLSPALCSCDPARGFQAPASSLVAAAWQQFKLGAPGSICSDWCACELTQLDGPALVACETDPVIDAPPGFCYVDPAQAPASEALVAHCPENSKRALRFLGGSAPLADGSSWFIACSTNPLP